MFDVKLIGFTLVCFSFSEIVGVNYCEICATPGTHTLCKYVVAGPSAACAGYKQPARLSELEGRLILARINERRNAVALGLANATRLPCAADMRKIEWSAELSVMAQRWVDQCDPVLQPERLDRCRDLENMSVGQNIATVVGAAPGLQVMSLVDIWFMQSLDYGGSVSYFNKSAKFSTRFFTQLIWAESQLVGCGKANFLVKARVVERLVCNFAPSGNVFRAAVYAVGYPATRCPFNTKPDAEYPGLCSGVAGELEISSPEGPTLQQESSLLRILNFPNATENKINRYLDYKTSKDVTTQSSYGTNARSQKIRQISYNKSNDYFEDYYDFSNTHKPKNNTHSASSDKYKGKPAKSPSNLLKHNYFGSMDQLNPEAIRYNPETMQYNPEAMWSNPDAMAQMQGYGNMYQRRKEHKCTRRHFEKFAGIPSEHICTRNSHSDPCGSSSPCKHKITTTIPFDACGDHVNKRGCNKCILCSRPSSSTKHQKQCSCDEQCKCLDTTKTTHECTSTECTQFHLQPSTMWSHVFKVSPLLSAAEQKHNHDGVICTETHDLNDKGRRNPGRFKSVKALHGNIDYSEPDSITASKKIKPDASYIDDDYLEEHAEWKFSKAKKKLNLPKQVTKKHNKAHPSKIFSGPSFYDHFAYSQRKRRDIKMDRLQSDDDYIDMHRISLNKNQLKGLKFTTLSKKYNRKATTITKSVQNVKRTEPITVKFRSEYVDNDNHKEHLKDKYLSFAELMNLKRSNSRADYLDHEYDDTLGHKKDESKNVSAKGQFSLAPQRRSGNETTTTGTPKPVTTPPKIKWCTRRHTCTWTAPAVGADGAGSGGHNINLSKLPYGYVDGCSRTSTCTRINYEKNKTPVKLNEQQNDDDADEEYCDERRSLDLGGHAHDDYVRDLVPGNEGKVALRSLNREENPTTSLPSQIPSVEYEYNVNGGLQTESSFLVSGHNLKTSRSIADVQREHQCSCHRKRFKRGLKMNNTTTKLRIPRIAHNYSGLLSYGDIFYQVLGKLLVILEQRKKNHLSRCSCYNKSLRPQFQFACLMFMTAVYSWSLFVDY